MGPKTSDRQEVKKWLGELSAFVDQDPTPLESFLEKIENLRNLVYHRYEIQEDSNYDYTNYNLFGVRWETDEEQEARHLKALKSTKKKKKIKLQKKIEDLQAKWLQAEQELEGLNLEKSAGTASELCV